MNTIILLSLILSHVIAFLAGRYVLFTKPGATLTRIVPTKVVRPTDFKKGNIYAAMASRLIREKYIEVQTPDPSKVLKLMGQANSKLSSYMIDKEEVSPGIFKIFIKPE